MCLVGSQKRREVEELFIPACSARGGIGRKKKQKREILSTDADAWVEFLPKTWKMCSTRIFLDIVFVCLFYFFVRSFLMILRLPLSQKKKILKKQKKDVTDNQLHANLGMFGLNTCVLLLKIYIYE